MTIFFFAPKLLVSLPSLLTAPPTPFSLKEICYVTIFSFLMQLISSSRELLGKKHKKRYSFRREMIANNFG